jgi:hypothetical protein
VSGVVSVVFFLQVFFKDGGTALEMHHCGTLSCELFLWSVDVKRSEVGDAQQAERFVIQGSSFAPW